MKRLIYDEPCPDTDPLPLDIILIINGFVVDVGIVSTRNLLSWHSVNKRLSQFWSDPAYFTELMTKSGEKSMELFQKTRHGIYHAIYTNHFLYKQIFPMVDTLHERIINHIQLDSSVPLEDHVYKSFPDSKGSFLRYEDLVPMALKKRSEKLLQILSDYMCHKCGWLVELHEQSEQIGFTTRVVRLICLRAVEKLYTKAVTK